MENRNIVHRGAKRRRVNSSSAVQNQSLPRKMVIILDDTWLEALKHLTCSQWSQIGLVCRQVKGIVQQNLSRLPRQVIESIDLNSIYLLHEPSMKHSLRVLLHPASYVKVVEMPTVNQNLINGICNGEERYIRCNSFNLKPYRDISATSQKIERSLKWLERNVCSDSISLPDWMVNKIHKSDRVREMLTNFIFDTSQKCKAQELVFSFPYSLAYYDDLFFVQIVDVLIEVM
ncbi:hypothetical protein Ddc_24135 [Ditylenchus destructor]|nr:hypothetical protein Ddc_24135 [Ditylenchus destructor]